MENENIMGESMHEKFCDMHNIAYQIEDFFKDRGKDVCDFLSETEIDLLYVIIDDLEGRYIIDRITGHCSLQDMLDNPPEKLEKRIDDNIAELLKIKEKYNID